MIIATSQGNLMRLRLSALLLAVFVLLPQTAAARPPLKWIAAWSSSQMIPTDNNILPAEDLTDATLRQVIRVARGGHLFRLRLSNQFGTAPLMIENIRLARPLANTAPAVDPASDVMVTFSDMDFVVIPAGAEILSDPISIPFVVPDLSDIAVTFYLSTAPAVETSHPGARANSWLIHGRHSSDADLAAPKAFVHWFFLSGLELAAPQDTRAIVTFGDSITDGYGVQPGTNARWPDTLMRRLAAAGTPMPVLNSGIGGNRLLLDGLGPSALARFDREVLAQPGVGYIILLEGVNDLGMLTRDAPATPEAHTRLVANMIAAYSQMIERAHAHGIKIYGATISPFNNDYYHPTAETEADRLAVNAWIRAPGHFDAVIDFDQILRDPANPGRLNPAYDSGDHLHPSIEGYKVMGESVPLSLFKN